MGFVTMVSSGFSRKLRALLVTIWWGLILARAFAQSGSPAELYQNGLNHFTQGQYSEAARFFDELIRFFGREPSLQQQMEGVYYAHGCALYNLGRYAEAIEQFKLYADRYPQAKFRDEALYRIAVAHQNLGAWDSAVESYHALLAAYPSSPFAEDAAYQIAICRISQNRPADAVSAFREFLQAYPESEISGVAAVFLARTLFDMGKRAEALAQLKAMESRPLPWNIITYANLLAFEIGDAAYDDTEYELALQAYRRIKTRSLLLRKQRETLAALRAQFEAFQKERPAPDRLIGRFQRERRLTAAIARAEELLNKLESLPDYDAGLFHRIGRCFFYSDRFWEARVAFDRVVREATDETVREAAHFDLILALSRLRQFEKLIAEADRYLDRYDPEWKRD